MESFLVVVEKENPKMITGFKPRMKLLFAKMGKMGEQLKKKSACFYSLMSMRCPQENV